MKKLILTLVFLLFIASSGFALSIKNLTLGSEGGYLVCSWNLYELPKNKLDAALHHGVPVRLQFEIVLEKIKRFWWDERLLYHIVLREIYYDAVKNIYLVQLVGSSSPPKAVSSLEEALALAGNARNVPIMPLNLLTPQQFYRLKIKVTAFQKISPNLPSRVLRFLFKGGKIESDWVTIRFKFSE
ncbi:DUF4390 domain-containing protein [Thermodesulfatator autotrophicus]|uniref:DUF4390 domain-containing protein n=1 Tax=Thermodesulfatator autotrophicus TaxID=1795632 RepID=A0A177E850_9BACT|nr:DUF4390 domain-containing protein [Thermodesulfatator autotrophicus]OAG28075.1 hypothetical protein TH606_03595 [Thermodesulfatator autotrophicus]